MWFTGESLAALSRGDFAESPADSTIHALDDIPASASKTRTAFITLSCRADGPAPVQFILYVFIGYRKATPASSRWHFVILSEAKDLAANHLNHRRMAKKILRFAHQ